MKGVRNRQEGVALITLLLIVAITTVIASKIVTRLQFAIERTHSLHRHLQAYEYALGGEALARQLLHQDMQSNAVDHTSDSWAQLPDSYQFTTGELRIQIVDLQSRLNINNLVDASGELDTATLLQWQRLFDALALPADLLQALIDWLDSDSVPRTRDSEDSGYLTKEPAYRAANAPLLHLSELALIKGWETQHIETLAPYITVLPGPTSLNINTAPAQVLASLADELTQQDAESLISTRTTSAFTTVEDFLADTMLAGTTINAQALATTSRYFGVFVQARFDGRQVQLFSLLQRYPDSGAIRLIARNNNPTFMAAAFKNELAEKEIY